MKYEFSIFTHCLFCFKELPPIEKRSGKGEHIIPKNIEGFWTSKDICTECKKYFGKEVDKLPKKNLEIVRAVENLKMQTKVNFLEGVQYSATDKFTGEEIAMYKKKDTYKVKTQQKGESKLNLDEKDILYSGLQFAIEKKKDVFSIEEIKSEIERMQKEYLSLDFNQSITSNKIGISMRRGQVSNLKVDSSTLSDLTPLIAKIAVFFIYYYLYLEDIPKIFHFEQLLKHARYNQKIEDWIINWYPAETEKFERFHRIDLEILDGLCVLDIQLFKYANWRILLPYDNELLTKKIYDSNKNEFDLEITGLVLDFADVQNKKMYTLLKLKEEADFHYYPIN